MSLPISKPAPRGLQVKSKLLPAYCRSGRQMVVDGVVVHYFSCKNVDPERQFDLTACRNLFLDLNRPRRFREFFMRDSNWPDDRMYASAHYLIGRDGETWRLAEADEQTYHAGASIMNGRKNCNQWALGIELIGTRTSGFAREQYQALAKLLAELEEVHGFPRVNVQGHDTVRWAANLGGADKADKTDPSGQADGKGENFDWFYLGKMWNEIRENPAGVATIDDLDDIIESDPLSG